MMTEKITSMSSMPKEVKKTTSRSETEQAAVRELVKAARARGEDLTSPDGLLKVDHRHRPADSPGGGAD